MTWGNKDRLSHPKGYHGYVINCGRRTSQLYAIAARSRYTDILQLCRCLLRRQEEEFDAMVTSWMHFPSGGVFARSGWETESTRCWVSWGQWPHRVVGSMQGTRGIWCSVGASDAQSGHEDQSKSLFGPTLCWVRAQPRAHRAWSGPPPHASDSCLPPSGAWAAGAGPLRAGGKWAQAQQACTWGQVNGANTAVTFAGKFLSSPNAVLGKSMAPSPGGPGLGGSILCVQPEERERDSVTKPGAVHLHSRRPCSWSPHPGEAGDSLGQTACLGGGGAWRRVEIPWSTRVE